jgi:hypothetical protein
LQFRAQSIGTAIAEELDLLEERTRLRVEVVQQLMRRHLGRVRART